MLVQQYDEKKDKDKGEKEGEEGDKDEEDIFPRTLEGLLLIPGVGPYTGGAIASIAYVSRFTRDSNDGLENARNVSLFLYWTATIDAFVCLPYKYVFPRSSSLSPRHASTSFILTSTLHQLTFISIIPPLSCLIHPTTTGTTCLPPW